jgi:predicted neutral ceramidase superfamily lipid hydrolase
MKTLIVIGVVAIAGGVFSAIGVCEQDKPSSHRNTEVKTAAAADGDAEDEDAVYQKVIKASKDVNLDLDEKSAVAIAEIVLVKVYGKQILGDRPWHVKKHGKVFRIRGTVHTDLGAAATIEINQTNAQVMSVIVM